MFNFTLHLPTKILFGKGQIAEIKNQIPTGAKILMTYGGGSIKRNGVYDQVLDALKGFEIVEFSGIEPNPQFSTLMKAVELGRREKVDFLLAVGGGSVLDGTKFIASAINFQGDEWEIVKSRGTVIKSALPIGAILTLPATGSEMNGNAVVSRKETQDKLGFFSPFVKPQFSVLDPTTTFSLPAKQTANGVVDAFVHTFEQYMTYPVDAKVQDRFAEGVFLTLIEEGPKALAEPENYDVRANIMWAATMALNGILGVGVPQDWASHGIGHELTAQYGLDHGQTLAIVVPTIMWHQREFKKEKLVQFAQRVWGYQGNDREQAIRVAIDKTRAFFEQMGTPTRLSAYGIDDSQFPSVLSKLKEHKTENLGEHKNIDIKAAEEILRLAL
ncbi:L-1,2-propanediol oxidoreductase [Gallibacterium anatis UMN179]|uniref:L-1,2-propanediol oxidoreductase n=1 Tax=Gallibacterium anatis (strain UMN179) TaxID=1005058 RepID=F4HFK9_GALAU|nr:iron-containing alcohol dehydrogenase [Gallibacterium anatis]AEC17050.1 L-1,2-propanediol oxidoreductase [Gallibacterium anatis UMN179]